ncbi:MAG: carbohydrate kinase family protein [Armatimonadota bacterium]
MIEVDVLAIGTALVEMTPQQLGASLAQSSTYEALPSGATTNFCLALAKLGTKVSLATRVGDDELGRWLLDNLKALGVDTTPACAVEGQYTPVSFCWMDQDGAKTFYFYRFPGTCEPMGEFGQQPLTDAELRRAQLFDFSEATIRSEPLRSLSLQAARRAKALGLQVCYAVNYREGAWQEDHEAIVAVQREALALADVAVMNREEAEMILGKAEWTAADLHHLGPAVIAVTDGSRGAYVAHGRKLDFIPASPVEVRYDIGAGDTFHAGLLSAILRGYDPLTAAKLASCAAALRISRTADMSSLPTWEEVLAEAGEDEPSLEGAPL